MMYEMLTGEQPFKGEQPMQIAYQHANDSVPAPSSKNPKVPAELDELVLWATARDPEQRPRDARVMLDQLLDTERPAAHGPRRARTTTSQRTMVLPAAHASGPVRLVDRGRPPDETQIIEPSHAGAARPGLGLDGRPRRGREKRRGRGWSLFAGHRSCSPLAAGGAGWCFGAGPGREGDDPAVDRGRRPPSTPPPRSRSSA